MHKLCLLLIKVWKNGSRNRKLISNCTRTRYESNPILIRFIQYFKALKTTDTALFSLIIFCIKTTYVRSKRTNVSVIVLYRR